jgi:hypothetical protein
MKYGNLKVGETIYLDPNVTSVRNEK